jgi:hypothetical protein
MTITTGQKMYASDILNLTFFPKGTILIFSTAAWNNAGSPVDPGNPSSLGFRDIWKVCNAANHAVDPTIPDLTNVFLRGAESSGTIGGADSRSVTLTTTHLPAHNHGTTNLTLSPPSLSALSLNNMSISGQTISGLTVDNAGSHGHTSSSATASDSGAHGHTFSSGSAASAGGHTHTVTAHDTNHTGTPANVDTTINEYGEYHSATYTTSSDGAHTHTVSGAISDAVAHTHTITVSVAEGGSHSHTVNSSNATISGGTFSGSISGGAITDAGSISGSVDSAGSGQAFSVDTVPSYYTVIYIMKVV